MHRQNVIALVFLTVISIITVSAGLAKGWGPLGVIQRGIARATGAPKPMVSEDNMVSDAKSRVAPDFAAGTWINSEPLKLKDLRGRVVLVEFWTYGCYNCRNVLPFVNKWHERYKDKGLTVVGVHTPEFVRENKVETLRQQVASLGIKYPVVTDNDYETWNAYRVNAWPTIFLLDKGGRVRWMHVGEGAYEETEKGIQNLLAEDHALMEVEKKKEMTDKIMKTDEEWQRELSAEQFRVLRQRELNVPSRANTGTIMRRVRITVLPAVCRCSVRRQSLSRAQDGPASMLPLKRQMSTKKPIALPG